MDLFFEKFSPRDKALVNLVGGIVFLLPWSLVLLYTGWQFALEAWTSGEGSPNPNGIPTFFPIKAVVPLADDNQNRTLEFSRCIFRGDYAHYDALFLRCSLCRARQTGRTHGQMP